MSWKHASTMVFSERNSNWVIQTKGEELKQLYLSNATARKFIRKIGELYDFLFKHHSDGGARRHQFKKVCTYIHKS